MVTEWKIGDRFEVLNTCKGYYLKQREQGTVIEVGKETVYFRKGASIEKTRIKKISLTIEIW